jgi:hypothetical protein
MVASWSISEDKYPHKKPEGNPTIVIYNASAIKVYSATNSMARFYVKKFSDVKTL